MIQGERYVFKRKGKYKSWFLFLLIISAAYGIYRYWPQISSLWKIKTEEVAKRLAQIEAQSATHNAAELKKIVELVEKDLISNPDKTANFLLLGQAYQSLFPKKLDDIILYFIKREAGVGSSHAGIIQQENLEKSASYLLQGYFLCDNEKEKRLFRILLANNYLFRESFYLSEIMPLIQVQKLSENSTLDEFSERERHLLIFSQVTLGKVDALKKILDSLANKKETLDNSQFRIKKNTNLLLGLANYYAKKWVYAIYYLKPYLDSRDTENKSFMDTELLSFFLGQIYLKNLQFKESEKIASEMIGKKANSVLAFTLLGKIFYEKKFPERAREAFLKVLEIQPEHKEAQYYLKVLGH
jgi:predicted nicotinamide N-methyase